VTSSRLPQTLDYLVAMAAGLTATTLAGVFVQDGPPTSSVRGEQRVLVIGGRWEAGQDSRPAGAGVQAAGMGNASRNEAITVQGSAFSQSGDTDIKARRDDVFAALAVLEQAIVGDRTLGGLVLGDARVSAVDGYRPVQNERGAAAVVDFTISATALLWDG
jgi:hypothetical protein